MLGPNRKKNTKVLQDIVILQPFSSQRKATKSELAWLSFLLFFCNPTDLSLQQHTEIAERIDQELRFRFAARLLPFDAAIDAMLGHHKIL